MSFFEKRFPSRIIESYELPYLDQVRHLPLSMMPHLNQHMVKSLSPTVSLSLFLCSWFLEEA
jgi:hypothetical protein